MAEQNIKYSDMFEANIEAKILALAGSLDQISDAYMNTTRNIVTQAEKLRASLTNSSGATKQQRIEISASAKQADELRRTMDKVDASYTEAAVSIARAKEELRQQGEVNKNVAALQTAASNQQLNSYKSLAAQYNLYKLALNQVSKENTVFVQTLDQATGKVQMIEVGFEDAQQAATKLYADMNKLQTATGKYVLQVGNYALATDSSRDATASLRAELKRLVSVGNDNGEQFEVISDKLRSVYAEMTDVEASGKNLRTIIMELKEELIAMDQAGLRGSEMYNELLARTGELQKQMDNTRKSIKATASTTATLDSVMGGMSAAGGAIALYTAAMTAAGSADEDVQKAQRKLQTSMAALMGLTTLATQLQKQSALMTGIQRLQDLARAKSLAIASAAQATNTKGTIMATVAQTIFNKVAAMNPYVLLAIALITVVGALVAFSSGAEHAAKIQRALNEETKAYIGDIELLNNAIQRRADENINLLEQELALAKAQKRPLNEIFAIEQAISDIRIKSHKEQAENTKEFIRDIDKNRKALEKYEAELKRLKDIEANPFEWKTVKAPYGNTVTQEVRKMPQKELERALKETQQQVDIYSSKYTIGINAKLNLEKDAAETAAQAKEQQDQLNSLAKAEAAILRETASVRRAILTNSHTKEMADLKASYADRIVQIQEQLKYEENLTETSRKSLQARIGLLQQQANQEAEAMELRHQAALRNIRREAEDAVFAATEASTIRDRAVLQTRYHREVEDLENSLAEKKKLGHLLEGEEDSLTTRIISKRQERENALKQFDAEATADELSRAIEAAQLQLDAELENTGRYNKLRLDQIELQRREEIARNNALTEEKRQSEAAINAKYDKMALDQNNAFLLNREMMLFEQSQALAQSEFDLQNKSEGLKTKFALEQERERLKKILELRLKYDPNLTDEERKTMENQLKALDKSLANFRKGFLGGLFGGKDMWEALGIKLDDDEKAAIKESFDFVKEQLLSVMDSMMALADAAVESATRQRDAAQTRVDAEIEASKNGYANNADMAQKELELAEKNRQKALKQQQKAQRAQAVINSLQQASDLITATAKIWSIFGNPLVAIPMTALMWGSFAAAKIKAAQASKASQEYGEGGYEFVDYGGSHASGNDIDFGTTPDGKRRKIERGEFWGIVRKSQVPKYRNVLPAIFDSLNKGSFENIFPGYRDVDVMLAGTGGASPADLSALEGDVRRIRQQGDRRIYVDAQGRTVIQTRNSTKIINHAKS